jgi:hypothetical protein
MDQAVEKDRYPAGQKKKRAVQDEKLNHQKRDVI